MRYPHADNSPKLVCGHSHPPATRFSTPQSWGACMGSLQILFGERLHWSPLTEAEKSAAGVGQWPHLNKIKTTPTDLAYWKRHVHTVQAWIDARHRTSGVLCKQNKKQRKKNQKRLVLRPRGHGADDKRWN